MLYNPAMPYLLSQFIEAYRWLAALTVLMFHTSSAFVNQADIMTAPHAAPVYVWWFFIVFQLAHQAVVGFFVLSGWLVGGAVLAHIRRQQPFLRDYLIHRFSRVYLVLAPVAVLTAAVDAAGRHVFAQSGVYDWPVFVGHTTLPIFLGTLANLQEILTPFFGTNGPLWSLACEFWYYITFPLLLLPFARNYSTAMRFGGFAIGVGAVWVLATPPGFFRIGYVLWALGAFSTLLPRAPVSSRWLAIGIYGALLILIRFFVRGPYLEAHPWLAQAGDLAGGSGFILALLAFRDAPNEGFSWLRSKTHKTLADFSFSLYSTHMPLLMFLRAATGEAMGDAWVRQLATLPHYLLTLASAALIFALAYIFSRFTEAKTGATRRKLREIAERLSPTAAPAAPSHRARAPEEVG